MMDPRIIRLRGTLAPEEPGARGIERVARNPDCLRLRALTIVGIKPATAVKILGGVDREGQSPFALTLGQRFERQLIKNGAANLLALYRDQRHLTVAEAKVADIGELAPGSGAAARRRRERETRRALEAKLRGDPLAPNLIIKPRLTVSLVGVSHPIEPDYLVAADGEAFYRVGEIKSYPDRGGKTDQSDIRSACRQAAVGVIGLRQILDQLAVTNSEHLAVAEADLVLRVTGLFLPTLHRQSIKGEIDSVLRAIADAPTNLDELDAMLPHGVSLDNPAVLRSVPNHYRPSCKEHCGLWEQCRGQALAARHPIVLGDLAAEKLAAASSVDRALDLVNSTGAPPRNAAEAALGEELRAADTLLRRAIGQ
ncbi:MAG: hypothetical protein JNN22_04990 [Rhodospirillales bacterium]|nr:hypothetical protein [Rhodospirillales bacterium]